MAFLLSCREPRQGVDPCVVLLADVLYHYPLEPGDKVGNRVVIPLQQFKLPIYLIDYQLRVAFTHYLASSHVVR